MYCITVLGLGQRSSRATELGGDDTEQPIRRWQSSRTIMVTSRSVQRMSARRPAEVKRESFEGDIEESLRMKKGLSDFKARSGNLIKNYWRMAWCAQSFPFSCRRREFSFRLSSDFTWQFINTCDTLCEKPVHCTIAIEWCKVEYRSCKLCLKRIKC